MPPPAPGGIPGCACCPWDSKAAGKDPELSSGSCSCIPGSPASLSPPHLWPHTSPLTSESSGPAWPVPGRWRSPPAAGLPAAACQAAPCIPPGPSAPAAFPEPWRRSVSPPAGRQRSFWSGADRRTAPGSRWQRLPQPDPFHPLQRDCTPPPAAADPPHRRSEAADPMGLYTPPRQRIPATAPQAPDRPGRCWFFLGWKG